LKFQIDLTAVQDLKPVPAGVYVLRVIEIDGDKTSRAGNKKLVVKYEIKAPSSVAQTQKFFWGSLTLVESAFFRIKQLFEACNVPIRKEGFDTTDLIGKEVGAIISEEHTQEFGHRNQIVQFLKAKETKPELKPQTASASAPQSA
jgi:hypothetical protein